jgi:hypothetical protein
MPFLRKYATATASGTHVGIPMPKAGSPDFATGSDWVPASGDVKISIDGGSQANITTLPSYTNGQWLFQFTTGETTGKSIRVAIVDSATKAVDDNFFVVETFGNASAMYPPDFTDATRLGLGALPSAAVNQTGGLLAPIVATGTCQAGSTTNGINLQAGASGISIGDEIWLTGGTGANQRAVISEVDLGQSPPLVFVAPALHTIPDATTTYRIIAAAFLPISAAGVSGLDAFGASVPNGADDLAIPSAIAIRQEMDSNSTKLAHLQADITATPPTATANANALLDLADGVETGWTFRQAMRLIFSVLLGKSSNGGSTFRDVNDTKARVTATVDSSNNRTTVVRDAS